MIRYKQILGLLLLLLSPVLSFSQTPASNQPWRAQWISTADADKPNTWIAFRKNVKLEQAPSQASLRIACDSKYWLWINGKLVVFEGQLKRGPTPTDTYFDLVELTPHLKQGENTFAVLVWYFGKEGMSHKSSGKAGLLFDASVDGMPLASDKTWKVTIHPAYEQTQPPHPNWRLPESNIRFNAQHDLADWFRPEFDDSEWANALELGTPPTEPWNNLMERSIPQWRNSGLLDYTNAAELPKVSTDEPIIAKLPANIHVTPYLEIEADSGKVIDIRTDNYKGGSEFNVRAEYVTRGGKQAYESLGWMNGHEVIYQIPAGIKIHALKYRETGYDTDLAGKFECDDVRLNRLWQKAQRTLYVEMRDGYADCPGRERAQWWGDITLDIQQAFYALDRRSDLLARKAILDLALWQKPTGELFSPIPAGNWDKELPIQMLASVGRYGFWEYYRHTGDRETIKQVYPAVGRYLSLWKLGRDGLVVPRKGGWTWGDWGKNKDMPLLFNAWYYLALDGQAKMAQLLGDSETESRCSSIRKTMHLAFNREFWTKQGYRSPEHKGPLDDRGNALAIVAGLVRPAKYETITRVLNTQQHASPYMEKYVLEALLLMGQTDTALDRMLERFGSMIDSPLSTLWEGWGIGPGGFGGGSYNHAWSGGPLTLLSQYIAGIDPLEPGGSHFSITPRLGRLEHVAATVVTKHGEVKVEFTKDHDKLNGTITVPKGSQATLRFPNEENATITWPRDSKREPVTVWKQPLGVGMGMRRPFQVRLTPGKHVFRLESN